jgi:hypothetical protein
MDIDKGYNQIIFYGSFQCQSTRFFVSSCVEKKCSPQFTIGDVEVAGP